MSGLVSRQSTAWPRDRSLPVVSPRNSRTVGYVAKIVVTTPKFWSQADRKDRSNVRWMLPLAFVALAAPVSAGPLVVTDRALFEALLGGDVSITTFDTPTPCVIVAVTGSCNATLDDFVIKWDLPEIAPNFTLVDTFIVDGTHTRLIDLRQPTAGFGFDIASTDGLPFEFTFVFDSLNSLSLTLPTQGFIGVIGRTDLITRVSFNPWDPLLNYGTYSIDNITIATPEPTTLALVGVALAAGMRNRRKRVRRLTSESQD